MTAAPSPSRYGVIPAAEANVLRALAKGRNCPHRAATTLRRNCWRDESFVWGLMLLLVSAPTLARIDEVLGIAPR